MVGHVLGLKLQILIAGLKRDRRHLLALSVLIAGAVAVTVFSTGGLAELRSVDPQSAAIPVVLLGSLALLLFAAAPIALGVDDPLDPRIFAPFDVDRARLPLSLALAGGLSVPCVALAAVALAQIGTWARSPVALLVSLVAAIVVVCSGVLLTRISVAASTALLVSRRARELTGLAALLLVVCVTPVFFVLARVDGAGLTQNLRRFADAAAWTPFGAVWAAPAQAAAGDTGAGFGRLLLAIVYLGALWLIWRAIVTAMMTAPNRRRRMRAASGMGWFGALPASPVWVVAARSFTYWERDSRYWVQLAVLPVTSALVVGALLLGGAPGEYLALLPVPIACLFLGWAPHNDVAYDSSAIWLHVASGVSGVADRIGRTIPILVGGGVLIAVGAPISAAVSGQRGVIGPLVGVSLCLLLSGLGLSSALSALVPYPAVTPGDSPFAQPQSAGATGALVQAATFFAALGLSIPPLLLAFGEVVAGVDGPMTALAAGVWIGLGTLVLGVLVGGWIFDRRGAELLAASMRA